MTARVFPDVRWGSEASVLRRPLVAFSATRPGSWLIRTLTPLDRRLLLRSRGRLTVLGPVGVPVLLLTTTGSVSGLPRTTPLLFVRSDPAAGREELFVVGSNFGQARHPAWTTNLLTAPQATVTIGGRDIPVLGRQLAGVERDAVWQQFVTLAHTYEAYRGRTTRDLRIFGLRPA